MIFVKMRNVYMFAISKYVTATVQISTDLATKN